MTINVPRLLLASCLASLIALPLSAAEVSSRRKQTPAIPATFHLQDEVPAVAPQPQPEEDVIIWGNVSDNYRACDHARAGCPQSLRWLTIPSNTRFYGGYYVGGGVPVLGEGRYPHEGTWGWDYPGILFTKRIALNWTHGRREQGGTGAYKTDGPKLEHRRE